MLMFVLLALEHVFILLKVFLSWAVPDKPSWVVAAEARAQFMHQAEAEEDDHGGDDEGDEAGAIADVAVAALKDSRVMDTEIRTIFDELQLTPAQMDEAKSAMKADYVAKHPPKPKKGNPNAYRFGGGKQKADKGAKGAKPKKEKAAPAGDKKSRRPSLPSRKKAA